MKLHKIKAKLFSLLCIVFIASSSLLAQGPNAPEAGSFEPVDATDMVNLLTGDLSYVLPLMNIPSPEGGYPIALSYHAGIAMDQEASWVGLGWNINPGAINRSINGYADDFNGSLIEEYFYDKGNEDHVYSISTGYSNGVSVGVGVSWGSNQSLGGYVSIGVGLDVAGFSATVGTSGSSVGIYAGIKGGLSVGLSLSDSGAVGASVGFNNNGQGFSIGASSNGSYNFSLTSGVGNENYASLGINFSSSGTGITAGVTKRSKNVDNNNVTYNVDGGAGVGLSIAHASSINSGDYSVKTSGFTIPIYVPTSVGVFSFSFGKHKIKYNLAKRKSSYVDGPIYFNERGTWRVTCILNALPNSLCGLEFFDTYEEAIDYKNTMPSNCDCVVINLGFMDVYEFDANNFEMNSSIELDINNPSFPSYDKYNVQAQGISGSIKSKFHENGALFGEKNHSYQKGYKVDYLLTGSFFEPFPEHLRFDSKPYFYFENEISNYLQVTKATFFSNPNFQNIGDYYNQGVQNNALERSVSANYVDYFTNSEINNEYNDVKLKGYVLPEATGFDRLTKPEDGIGAFIIVSSDGKKYHYSLPVYNHEIVTRSFGHISSRPNENQAYVEKRQLEPFATHWLLTAITGPDYIDINNNGNVDVNDFGYWVSFEYGKWSDAFIWKNPYGEEYLESTENSDLKTWIRGRKEVYFLDKIKTRSHTALFVKDIRTDFKSVEWQYKSVGHIDDLEQDESDYNSRFNIASHETLKLKKIILLKNEDDLIDKSSGPSTESSVLINYNESSKPPELAYLKSSDNILDVNDNIQDAINSSLKVIEMNQDYSLVNCSPNSSSGKLTLNNVTFNGKANTPVIPSYKFDYLNTSYCFDIDDIDEFGYVKDNNSLWSLNEITTPQGGKINIEYENDKFLSAIKHKVTFSNTDQEYPAINMNNNTGVFYISSDLNFGISVGHKIDVNYYLRIAGTHSQWDYQGPATIIEDLGNNEFKVQTDGPIIMGTSPFSDHSYYLRATYIVENVISRGGIRTSKITLVNDLESSYTEYKYGENEDGIGYASYLPYTQKLLKEVSYSMELPSPRVMYEYVVVKNSDINDNNTGKIKYKFKIIKEKEENDIKFGDLYEIDIIENDFVNNVANKDVSINEFTIKDNLASLGQLLEITTYNVQNQVLNKRINNYYLPGQTPNLEGVIQESYQTYKTVNFDDNSNKKDRWIINSSTRIKYPNFMKSTQQLMNGSFYSTEFSNINTDTGQYLETTTSNSLGDQLKTLSIPAYTKYPQMGSKVDNITNKNMLTQQAASYTFIDDNGTWKPIGVGITTWNNYWTYIDITGFDNTPTSNDQKIWRKHKSFMWDGNIDTQGTLLGYDVASDDGFDWTVPDEYNEEITQVLPWKQFLEITQYDNYSKPLEIKDLNNNYATTKMTDLDSKIILSCNAGYGEAFYTGAEYESISGDFIDQQIYFKGILSPEVSHTGDKSLNITTGNPLQIHLKANTFRAGLDHTYKISAWVHIDNYLNARIIEGDDPTLHPFNGDIVFAGNWVQLNHTFPIDNNINDLVYSIVTANANIFVDDVRFHPLESSMTSFVYNRYDELTFILGANNMATKYQYDTAGRLIRIFQETETSTIAGGFKKAKEYRYNYKRDIEDSGGGNNDDLVYFLTIDQHDDYRTSEAILIGPPNAVVTLQASSICGEVSGNVGDFDLDNFYTFSMVCDSNPSTYQVTIPDGGLIYSYITFNDSGSNPNLGGKAQLEITEVVGGTITTDEDNKVFYDKGLDDASTQEVVKFEIQYQNDEADEGASIAFITGPPGTNVELIPTYHCGDGTQDSGDFFVGNSTTDNDPFHRFTWICPGGGSNRTIVIPASGKLDCTLEYYETGNDPTLEGYIQFELTGDNVDPYNKIFKDYDKYVTPG